MKKTIQEDLLGLLSLVLTDMGQSQIQEMYLDLPTDSRFGDLSTNIALRLSKEFKKPPREVASSIIESLKKIIKNRDIKNYIKDIKVEGAGFINFYLEDRYFYEQLHQVVLYESDALRIDIGKANQVLIEFVSANPTGSLSVAHARQAAVGDALANILDFLGFKVTREYYLNDEGNQINILGRSVILRIKELKGEKIDFPEDHYQGDYIYDIAKEAMRLEVSQEAMGDFAAGYILEIIKKELLDFGVSFQSWYSQTSLRESGKIDEAFKYLKTKRFLYEQEGALWFKSTDFGDDKDRVVVKSDGSYTYLAPDIAYHQEKYLRGFSWLINLWGPDHHGYINRLKASVQAFNHPADSLSVIIVQLATIFRDGKPVQMSTRRGQYISLREVLDEVGKDAARFFFIMRRTSSHLDFDLEIAKKETSENPVYYVQYAFARICSILRSAGIAKTKDSFKDTNFSLLKEKEEMILVKKTLQFSSILNICLQSRDPYMLSVYLQELSESFHKFYDQHRVLGQDESLTKSRLGLIDAVRVVLAEGLSLLGVSKPEKM